MQTFTKCHNIRVDGGEYTAGFLGLDWFPSASTAGQKNRYEGDTLATLDRLMRSWTGWSVITEIFYCAKSMVIKPYYPSGPTDRNAFAQPMDPAAATLAGTTTLTSTGDFPAAGPASFTASIANAVLTVTAVRDGKLQTDMTLTGSGIPGGVRIVLQLSGTPPGGVGTYLISDQSITAPSKAMTGTPISRTLGTGFGSDVLVRFSSSVFTASGAPTGAGDSPDEILLHEMIHGLRQMQGRSVKEAIVGNSGMDNYEEFAAITISNVYRSEMNLPGLRADHRGFNLLTGATTNLATFKTTYYQWLIDLDIEQPRLCKNLRNVRCAFNPFT